MVALKPYIEMLQSSLQLQPEQDAVADGRRLRAIMITEEEWTTVEELIKILKPFDDVTKYISAGTHPTMSIIYPTIVALRDSITKNDAEDAEDAEGAARMTPIPGMEGDEDAFDGNLAYEDAPEEEDEPGRLKKRKVKINAPADTSNLIVLVKESMSVLFGKYFSVSSFDRSIHLIVRLILSLTNIHNQKPDDEFLAIATAIDPRCRGINLGETLTPHDYLELEFERLKDNSVESSPGTATLDLSGSFMSTVFKTARKVTKRSEIDQYTAMQPIDPSENPLEWWASRSSTLPKLASVARKYLAIPATSVPCERLFSVSGNIMNKRRTRLSSTTFGKIVFCNANEKRYGTIFPDNEESDEDSN